MAKVTGKEAHEILIIISDLKLPAMSEKGLQLAQLRSSLFLMDTLGS